MLVRAVKRTQVFTPLPLARWAAAEHGIVDAWLARATVLDPTAGDGALIEALIEVALARGLAAGMIPLARLRGWDRDAALVAAGRQRIEERYGIRLPVEALRAADSVAIEASDASVVFATPPWIAFPDLS